VGKKSRLKRERRIKKTNSLATMLQDRSHSAADDNEVDFKDRITQIGQYFSRYNAEDVALALNISDLWLPNISSQVKHHFAFGIFVSKNVDEFTSSNRLDTYALFHDFISNFYTLLPSFFMLEDYVPEADWGDIQIASKNDLLKIFYGGSVERIPDFIEAFRLRYQAQSLGL
jgi:hypothetical protein